GAAQKGAVLVLRLTIPDPVIQHLKPTTLSATANGVNLAPEQYGQSGDFTYTRDVPASAMTTENVPVTFTLDKALTPNAADSRELGIVVKSVGFELKSGPN